MKKSIYLFLAINLCLILFIEPFKSIAVKAYPHPIEFTQPDGSKINILLKGDEKVRWAETMDNYSILFNKTGFYVYAVLDNKGDMIPSGIQVKNITARSATEKIFLLNIPKSLHFSQNQIQMMKAAWSIYQTESQNSFPTIGNRNLICILIGFTNVAFTKTQSDFNNLFNQINYTTGGATGSVKDYYLENSYNQFNLTVTVAGPYTASHNMAYYGADIGANHSPNAKDLVSEAVILANPSVNYANFDNDLDGYVDGIYVIFAGYGQEAGASSDAIWSHASSINPTLTLDGKIISSYSCSPELRGNSGTNITGIGIICHEFGHVLGALDFYDTDYSTSGQYDGTGEWDLMADGNWNNNGLTPSHHNAYTKTEIYGWANYTTINSATQITLNNAAQNSNSFYRYNTGTFNEYFLIENRQQLKFDTYLPGHGMLIYHVDGTYIDDYGFSGTLGYNAINATNHQGMYPVCAGATGNPPITYGSINGSSCTFPGAGNKTSFTDATTPHSKSWAGVSTSKPITSITENTSNKTITFSFMGGSAQTFTVTPSNQYVGSASGNTQFSVTSTVSWNAVSNQSWCTLTSSGSGNGTITANFTANITTSTRTATITVTGTGVSPITVTVVQSGSATWPQSFEEANFPPTGWTVQNPIGGTGWESSLVGTTPVPGFTGGTVTSCPAGGNKMALVYYGSGSATSNNQWLISPSVVVTANKVLKFYMRKFGTYADTMYVRVSTTNNQISSFNNLLAMIGFTVADSGWVQYTYNLSAYTGQQIYIAFNEKINDNQTDGAALFLDMVDITDNSSNPTLSVSPSSQNVNSIAGNTQFTVTSNVAWIASSNQTWCTVTPSGNGNGTITANYTANTTTSSRTATITVTGASVNPVVVNVVQSGLTSAIWSSTMSNTSEWTVTNASNATLATQWIRLADTSMASTAWKNYVGPYMGSATPMNGVYYFDGITNLLNAIYGVENSRLTNTTPINTLGHPSVKIKFYQLYKSFNADSTLLEISSDNINWYSIDVNPIATANQYAYGWKEYNIGPWAGNKAQVWIRFRFFAPATYGSGPQYGGGYGWMIDDVSIEDNPQNSLTIDKLWIYDGYTQIPVQQNRLLSIEAKVNNNGAATQTNVKLNAKELSTSYIYTNSIPQTLASAAIDTILLDSISLPNVAGDYFIAPFISSDNVSQVFYNDTFKITLNNTNQFSRDYNYYYTSRWNNGNPCIIANMYEVSQQSTASSINFVVNLATKANSLVKTVLYRGLGANKTLIAESNYYSIISANIPSNTGLNPPSITLPFITPVVLYPDSVYWAGVEMYGGSDTVKIAVDNTAPMQNYYTSLLFDGVANQWYVWSLDQVYPSMIRLNLAGSTLSITPSSQNVSSASGSTQFAVTSNTTWTASSNQSWCTVTPSGSGNGTITANYTANTSASTRIATITITASGSNPVSVTVIQSGTGSIVWPQSFEEANFPPTGWTVQNPIGGTGWESSTIGTTPIPGFTGGTVTSCPAGGNKMALVYYGSGTSTSNNQWLISPSVVVTANKVLKFYMRKFGTYADTIYVRVSTTNNQISSFNNLLAMIGFTVADSGWVQYTYNLSAYTGQQIYIAFNEKINDNQTDGAALFIDMVDIADNSSNPTLSVSPSSQNVSSTSGNTQFSVTSNVNWTASSNQTWSTVTPSGTGNGTITANYTANNATTSRTAIITVNGTGVASQNVTVIQSGTGGAIWPQSFEEANFPPTAWSVQNPIGGTGWESSLAGTTPVPGFNGGIVTSCPGGGNKMALVYYGSGSATSNNQWLISPPIAVTANKVLKFYIRKFGTYADTMYVRVSTTNNQISSFNNLLAMIGFTVADSGWVQYTYNLAAYTGQQIYIAFNEKINDNQTDGAALFLDMVDITDNSSNPALSVSPSSQNVSSTAGNTQFSVTSNIAWTASSNQSWCTVTPSGTGNGIITANYTTNTATSSRIATITVNGTGVNTVTVTVVQSGTAIPDPAGAISGLTTVCQGQNNVVYSVPVINNATTYIWTLPNGATGSSITNSISVNYGSTAISGNITVKGSNSSGDGISSNLSIIVNPLPLSASSINGQTSVCQGQGNVVYSVPVITNATTYIWTLPNGALGSSNANSITVNYNSNATSGNITVKGQNSCGIGTLSSMFVVVNTTPPTPIIVQNVNTLTSNSANGNQWYNLATGIINNANAQTYLPQQIGNYFVIVSLNGCSSDSSNIIYYDNTGITEEKYNTIDIRVMPNPFTEITTLTYKLNENKHIRIVISDITGREIRLLYDNKEEKGEHRLIFKAGNLAKGIYFYKLNADNEVYTGKIILNK